MLLADLLISLNSELFVSEPKGHKAAPFFVFAGERRYAGTCRCIGVWPDVTGYRG
jgi:hypothetical protein